MFGRDERLNPFTRNSLNSQLALNDRDSTAKNDRLTATSNRANNIRTKYERESPLSQISSANSLAQSPDSEPSQMFTTALPYPEKAAYTQKKSQRVENIRENLGGMEHSGLIPNWNEKIPTKRSHGSPPMGMQQRKSILQAHGMDITSTSKNVSGSPFKNGNIFSGSSPISNAWPEATHQELPRQNTVLSFQRNPLMASTPPSGSTTLVDSQVSPEKGPREEKSIEKDVAQTKERPKRLIIGLITLVFLSSIPALLLLLMGSCRSNSGLCFPQFSLQLEDSSPHASEALESAREALRVLSYIAIDMGSPVMKADKALTDDDFLNTVDTFAYGNIFGLSFNGYCRDNIITGTRFCTSCYGMDIISTLVRDAGIQLAKIARRHDFKKVGESLALAYKVLLSNFDGSIYAELGEKNELVEKAKLINLISVLLADLVITAFSIASFNTLFLTSLLMVIACGSAGKFSRHLRFYTSILLMLESLVFILFFVICSIEFEYVYKLAELAALAGIATIGWDLGMYIMGFTSLLSGVSLIFCILFCYVNKRR